MKNSKSIASFIPVLGFFIIFCLTSICILVFSRQDSTVLLEESENRIQLESVQGGSYSLEDFMGKPLMLIFLHISPDAENENASQSRAQLNFIKSMETQYGTKEINYVIIDSSHLIQKDSNDLSTLINFTYDWKLDNIPLLIDTAKDSVAKKYDITRLPTTLLLDKNGDILQRWDGLALTSQLAKGIESILGDSMFVIKDSESVMTQEPDLQNENRTGTKAIFKGLDLAREISDRIWLVDGGKNWSSLSATPARWIVTGIKGKLVLQVNAEKEETGENISLIEAVMDTLPEEEALQITANFQNPEPSV